MRNRKLEIIPIHAPLPALKVLQNGQQSGFGADVDLVPDRALARTEFRLFLKYR
jgi:hypothetical protein